MKEILTTLAVTVLAEVLARYICFLTDVGITYLSQMIFSLSVIEKTGSDTSRFSFSAYCALTTLASLITLAQNQINTEFFS